MKKNGIFLGIHYKLPVHKQKILSDRKFYSITEKISRQIVSLPIYVGLTKKLQSNIIKLINLY